MVFTLGCPNVGNTVSDFAEERSSCQLRAVQVGPAVRSSTHRRQTYPTGGRQDKVRKLPRSTFNAPCRHAAAGCRRAGLCDANWRGIRFLLLLIVLHAGTSFAAAG